jgi:hypothetical protein
MEGGREKVYIDDKGDGTVHVNRRDVRHVHE